MNTLIVSGSMAVLAILGLIYFKYQDWRIEKKHVAQTTSED